MSTSQFDTWRDASGNNPSTALQVQQGRAKSWWNLNGTGVIAERDSFNVTSYTDNGVGDYTATFAAAMPNANYAPQITGNENLAAVGRMANAPRTVAPTTSALRTGSWDSGTTATDHEFVYGLVAGD